MSTAAPSTPVIEVRQLSKVYQLGGTRVAAVQGVNLTVAAGEFVAIMGPSGSGKSTLLHLLGCLDRPTTGVYRLEGRDTRGLGDRDLARLRNRHIGFVFQTFHLLPQFDALGNVLVPLTYSQDRGRRRERAQAALERVGLGRRLHHRPAEFSGGERQRVAIARATVTQPSLLLADEPTGSLDSRTGRQILDLLADLHREGTTVILVTHDPQVGAHARRVIRMLDGDVVGDELA